ncbi:nitroreductase [Marasmius fiardii PR-910]|nr:nitroreductase [Marasmius fiardii PR-910]
MAITTCEANVESKREKNPSSENARGQLVEAVDSIMKSRYSCRWFLPKPVPRRVMEEIIDAARFTPSGNNMQPWEKVYCIGGEDLKIIGQALLDASREQPNPYASQYHYYPDPAVTPPHYAKRRQEAGRVLYNEGMGIAREDKEGREKASSRNYHFFDAPVALVFTIHKDLTQGSWLDVGYFLQSITLAARTRGLESVSQESISRYHAVLRQFLPISEDEIVAVGMSMGYPDLDKVAQFPAHQPKREVSEIVRFHGL